VEIPLGVGNKTFVTGPPELPDTSSGSDLATFRHQATTKHRSRVSKEANMNAAVDAAGLRAQRIPTGTTQTTVAMQGIMEQGSLSFFIDRLYGY